MINSTGVHRLAWLVAWDMINRGFNVYGTGDTCDSFEHTVVVDLKDSSAKNARAVAEGLKAEKRIAILPMKREMLPRIEVKIDSTRFVDVLLILGEDYQVFFPAVEPFN
ncbi:LytR C-terminal domain-containing protein [candidate division WOR-3 bacterium]|nr:LytR C-terminal domain-containing protein [candidate division WOR-3 bacterium]